MTRQRHGSCRVIVCAITLLLSGVPALAREPSAAAILEHINNLYRGASSHSIMTVTCFSERTPKSMEVEVWSRGATHVLARVREPSENRGAATLRLGGSTWAYLPEVDRVIRIPRAMMGAPWMGSHLTIGDMIMEPLQAQDCALRVRPVKNRTGEELLELTLTPRSGAAPPWSTAMAFIRSKDWMPVRIEFFDERKDLARTMTFSNIREMGGRLLPAGVRVSPAGTPGQYTEIVYESIRFDVGIDESLFTLQDLREQGRP